MFNEKRIKELERENESLKYQNTDLLMKLADMIERNRQLAVNKKAVRTYTMDAVELAKGLQKNPIIKVSGKTGGYNTFYKISTIIIDRIAESKPKIKELT